MKQTIHVVSKLISVHVLKDYTGFETKGKPHPKQGNNIYQYDYQKDKDKPLFEGRRKVKHTKNLLC